MRGGVAVGMMIVAGALQLLGAETNGPVLKLSIEEAVLRGLQNNRGLRIEKLGPTLAGAFEQLERGSYDPEFFAEFSAGKEDATETARATETQFQVEGSEVEGEAGLRQRLATGTELEVSVAADRTDSSRSPEQQTARVGLSLTQQLLRGFGPAVNMVAIRQAELNREASEHELRGYVEALVADIETTYWRYVAAREAIRVFETFLDVANEQLKEVQTRVEVGHLSSNEVAAARSEVALRKQDLINARSTLTAQRYALLRLIRPDDFTERARELEAVSPPHVDLSFAPVADDSLQLAMQSRPEIKESELRLQRGELETVVTRNGRLPKLDLFINLYKTGYADSFGRSFRDLDGPGFEVSAGIELSMALGNREARARDEIARTEVEQDREALANLRDLVRFDVLLAINELERAQRQISASAETRRYREQLLQAERDRFEVGNAVALDVARVQRDLVESRIAEIDARVAYLLARIRLYLAEGSLLERRGLSLIKP